MIKIDKDTDIDNLIKNTEDRYWKIRFKIWFDKIGKEHKKRVNGEYYDMYKGTIISIEEPEYISSESYNCEVSVLRKDGSTFKYRDYI